MNRAQFTFYRSYYDAIQALPKKDQASVLLAICAYALDSEEPKLSGTAKAIFTLVRPTLDTGRRKAMGGKNGSPSKDNRKMDERCGKDSVKEKEGEKEVEVEGEIEIENECSLPLPPLTEGEAGKPPKGRFTPPSVTEVSFYCQERGNGIDAQQFVDFYASKGWMVGKNKMRDWRAAIRTWERDPRRVQEQQNKFGGDRLLDMLRTGVFDDE